MRRALVFGMKPPKALGYSCLAAAIGWAGFSLAELTFAKLPADMPAVQQATVIAVASVENPQDAHEAAGAVSTAQDSAEPLPPVAAGPADLPSSTDLAPEILSSEPAKVAFEETELMAAVEQQVIQAAFRGNGRDKMVAQLRNNSPTPMRVSVAIGQVLDSGRNRVVVTRAESAEIMPARTVDLDLRTAALHSSNSVGEGIYRLTYQNADRVDGFLKWADAHGGLACPAMQTAVFALAENLPLSALAKFAPATPGSQNTDAFRVETSDIMAALIALRDCGAKLESLAIAQDPQLRIEAMIEPLSREAAKRFYGISEEREWDYWKRELLEGSPSTRHYALFGIARFYPEVALEMLPKWARQEGTHSVYRLSAVQALADTQRPEALPILRTLAGELGATTELGKAATQAANFLDRRLTEQAKRSTIIAFRGKSGVGNY